MESPDKNRVIGRLQSPREKLYTPPPPPIFGQIFEGGGGVYFEPPPPAGSLYAPLFHTPLMGGVGGVYKIWTSKSAFFTHILWLGGGSVWATEGTPTGSHHGAVVARTSPGASRVTHPARHSRGHFKPLWGPGETQQ